MVAFQKCNIAFKNAKMQFEKPFWHFENFCDLISLHLTVRFLVSEMHVLRLVATFCAIVVSHENLEKTRNYSWNCNFCIVKTHFSKPKCGTMKAFFVIDRICRDDKPKPPSVEVRFESAFWGLPNAALKRKHWRSGILRQRMQICVPVVCELHSQDKKIENWKLHCINLYEHILHL